MKTYRKGLSILASACLLTVASTGAVRAGETGGGKTTYDKLCASCHGKDGKGNPAMAKALGEKGLNLHNKDSQAKSDEAWLKVIVQGAGKMPASGKNLNKQEQKDLISYTRSLTK